MGKIRYLVTDKAGRKLRRAVPKALQELAGRTAWVERVEGLRASEVRERANLFSARTDAEIRALERKAAVEPQPKAAGDDPAPLRLSRVEAQHIAIRFFREQDDRNMEDGDYLADPKDPGYDDILIEAGLDYQANMLDSYGDHSDRYADLLDALRRDGRSWCSRAKRSASRLTGRRRRVRSGNSASSAACSATQPAKAVLARPGRASRVGACKVRGRTRNALAMENGPCTVR